MALETWRAFTCAPWHDVEVECRAYLESIKLTEMQAASGNHQATALFRAREDRATVVVVMSVWHSTESVRAFRGDDYEAPAIRPTDRLKIFALEPKVRHYAVSDITARA